MAFTLFSTVVTTFNKFFGVVPCPTCIIQHTCKCKAGRHTSHQQTDNARNSKNDTGCYRNNDCHERRNNHLFLSTFCGNCHAFCIFGLSCTFHNTWDFSELPSHFIYHSSCISSYCFHCHCNKYESHHCSDEKTCE